MRIRKATNYGLLFHFELLKSSCLELKTNKLVDIWKNKKKAIRETMVVDFQSIISGVQPTNNPGVMCMTISITD